MDDLDRRIVGALLAHPRVTNAQIAQVTFTSEATVSRRLNRLVKAGTVRVTGVLDSRTTRRARSLFVRLRCTMGGVLRTVESLARWPECGSVKMLTGSVDAVAELSYTSDAHLLDLTLNHLPRLDGVDTAWSNQVIKRFSTPHAWSPAFLPSSTVAELRAQRPDMWRERPLPAPARTSELDERISTQLAADGRLGWKQLAERCGASPTTVRHHAEAMMASGTLRMRTVVEPQALGLHVNAFLWLTVSPTQLGRAGRILAEHPAVLMIAATTGDRNLCGEIAVESDESLFEFISETIGALPGLQHTDVAVSLRSVKRADGAVEPSAG